MKKNLLWLFMLLLTGIPVWAQGASSVAKEMLQSAVRQAGGPGRTALRPVELQKIARLKQLSENNFDDLDRMLEPYFMLPAGISPQRLAENKKLQKEMVRRWLEMDFYISRQGIRTLGQRVTQQVVQGRINYLPMLPPSSRLIVLGEYHDTAWVLAEVESVLRQIQQAYPGRTVYYASEFIYAHPQKEFYALRQADMEQRFGVVPAYEALAKRLAKEGVRLIGLENSVIRLSKAEQSRPEQVLARKQWLWNAISPLGMKERNQYWVRRIRAVYRHDPNALVVVHAGNAHACYNHLHSVPWLLKDLKPFVVSFSPNTKGNPLLESAVPLRVKNIRQAQELFRRNPNQPVLYIRQIKSKRTALVAGSDVHISLYKPENAPGRQW